MGIKYIKFVMKIYDLMDNVNMNIHYSDYFEIILVADQSLFLGFKGT
tara:strand:- start:11112 stop:11252 length:141 start_codon:yes stop_codon:yes gene_type:complete